MAVPPGPAYLGGQECPPHTGVYNAYRFPDCASFLC